MKPAQAKIAGTMRKIDDFHLDENFDWVAELECGHLQHVRHNPPGTHRHWVTTPQGRLEHLGQQLNCLACRAGGLRQSHDQSATQCLQDSLTILIEVTVKWPCSLSSFVAPVSLAVSFASSLRLCSLECDTTPVAVTV